jgi:hypothetical protein
MNTRGELTVDPGSLEPFGAEAEMQVVVIHSEPSVTAALLKRASVLVSGLNADPQSRISCTPGKVGSCPASRNCWRRDVSGRSPTAFPKLFQSRFNGGFERRDGAQLGPGNSGAQLLSRATEFPCRLADPSQTALYRIAGLEVLCESRQIHARREFFDQDDIF